MSTRKAAALVLLHAALFALSFHPAALFPLAWVCLVPEVILLRDARTRQAIVWTGAAHFLRGTFTVYWLTYMGAGPAPWLGTALGFGMYGTFFALLARPLASLQPGGGSGGGGFLLARRGRIPVALWLPVLWTGTECITGKLFFFAFPWIWLGHSQYLVKPLVQIADLGGALAVTFVVAAVNGLLVDWLAARPRVPRLSLAFSGALLVSSCVYGVIRAKTLEVIPGPRILAVQPFFPQNVKNETDFHPRRRLEVMLDLTTRAAAGKEIDLVAWPETIVPFGESDDKRFEYAGLDQSRTLRTWFAELGRRVHAPAFVGAGHVQWEPKKVEHNSAFLVSEKGEVIGRYDKMFLAPVSEETPFYESWPAAHHWIRATFVPPEFSQFERGKEAKVFEIGGANGRPRWKIGGSVCFDITFSEATNAAVRNGADVIVNVSNYAWFADSAELDLARVQSMFRAIETRRGIASAVNGGITHFVSPLGAIEDLSDAAGRRKEIEGALLRAVPTSRARTVFVALPTDAFAWGCFALSFPLALLALRRRSSP